MKIRENLLKTKYLIGKEKKMAKKLIEGKTRKSKTKKMSHTGGNSRPLNLMYNDVARTWHKIPE